LLLAPIAVQWVLLSPPATAEAEEHDMLSKEACLMIKSCLALIRSTNLQIDSLFCMFDAVSGSVLPSRAKDTFVTSGDRIKSTAAEIERILDTILENAREEGKRPHTPKLYN
jgi:hypothetical protein